MVSRRKRSDEAEHGIQEGMPPKSTISIVSPHQDDAALSLALTIRQCLQQGMRVRILNCFTVTDYAPCGSAQTVREVMRLRQEEDHAFTRRMGPGLDILQLGAVDSLLRMDTNDVRDVFSGAPFDERDGFAIHDVSVRLRAYLDGGSVLAPLAIRDHIDHRIVYEACCRTVDTDLLGFYEDMPYAAEVSQNEVHQRVCDTVQRTRKPLQRMVVGRISRHVDKVGDVSVYVSQLEPSDIATIKSLTGKRERIWVPSTWPQLQDDTNS